MSYKANLLFKGFVGAAILAATSTAFTAQEARTMLVTASIPGGCTLLTPPLAFGILNVTTPQVETQTVRASYRCALGINVTGFSVGTSTTGSFTGLMTGAVSGNTIPYSITWDPTTVAFTGAGFGVAHEVVLNGSIQPNDYATKAPDNYSQSVIVGIEF
jgi:hypothetical protein